MTQGKSVRTRDPKNFSRSDPGDPKISGQRRASEAGGKSPSAKIENRSFYTPSLPLWIVVIRSDFGGIGSLREEMADRGVVWTRVYFLDIGGISRSRAGNRLVSCHRCDFLKIGAIRSHRQKIGATGCARFLDHALHFSKK